MAHPSDRVDESAADRAPSEMAVAADGTRIAWWSRGSDAPVVLVHGITEQAASWAPVVERLAATHTVITLDLRGHGESEKAEDYGLLAMAGDVLAVVEASGIEAARLVGHSLGGAVVSVLGAVDGVHSIVNVDQSLRLGSFKAQLMTMADHLRDPAAFPAVIGAIFDQMAGDRLAPSEVDRLRSLRRPDQAVVLGIWELLLEQPEAAIEAAVEEALAGSRAPFLSLFGIDPGPDYGAWLAALVPGAVVETWEGYGHYPHLVDPDRFVARLETFWAGAAA